MTGSPLTARVSAAIGALGTNQVLVWGGLEEDGDPADANPATGSSDAEGAVRRDGAVYDLREGRWAQLPTAPLAPAFEAVAVTTSTNTVLIAGGRSASEPIRQAALLTARPDGYSWTKLPAPPNCPTAATVLPSGEVVTTGACAPEGAEASLFDPISVTWTALPDTGLTGPVVEAEAWNGSAVVFDQSGEGRLFDGSSWEVVPAVPDNGTSGAWFTEVVAGRLLAAAESSSGSAQVVELTADGWIPVATGGSAPAEMSAGAVAVGDAFVWGTAAGVCSWAEDADVSCVEAEAVSRTLTDLVRVGDAVVSWGGRTRAADQATATPTSNGVVLHLEHS